MRTPVSTCRQDASRENGQFGSLEQYEVIYSLNGKQKQIRHGTTFMSRFVQEVVKMNLRMCTYDTC